MRSVAYVTTAFPTITAFVENEVHLMRQRGVRIEVFTLRPVGTHYQPDHASLLEITRYLGSPFAPAAWGELLRWLVKKPGVLVPEFLRIVWASRGSLYALVGHVGYLPATARIATEIERGRFERVHGAWSHFPGTVAYLVSKLTGVPFSLSAHAGSDLYRTQAFLADKVRAATFTSACVPTNADMLRRLAGPDARIEFVGHGVDLRRFDGSGRSRADEPTLLVVGRLAAPKGFDHAIRSLGLLRARGLEPHLDVAGDGPERAALESLVRECGVASQVTFHGALTHDQLLPLYRRTWALLAPSIILSNGRRDGIPNVVVEAMAMGAPCVATRIPGLQEIVTHGENGALAEPGDPESLAAALEPLLRDPARVDAMGARARQRVTREFDLHRNFERLFRLFEDQEADAEPARSAMP